MDTGRMGAVNRFAQATGWRHPVVAAYAGYPVAALNPCDILAGLLLSGLVAVLPYAPTHAAPVRLVTATGRTACVSGGRLPRCR